MVLIVADCCSQVNGLLAGMKLHAPLDVDQDIARLTVLTEQLRAARERIGQLERAAASERPSVEQLYAWTGTLPPHEQCEVSAPLMATDD